MTAPAYVISGIDLSAAHARAAAAERDVFRDIFRKRVRMGLREWAESRRYLSPEANALAAEAGRPVRYSTTATPYHRDVMDALGDPETDIVVCKFPSQDGKTEILNNFVGRAIDVDPGPMLVLQPTKELAESWSKDRLSPMIRDCPTLAGKVRDARSRDANNTTLHKKIPGGQITIVGSNSAAGVSARPIRDVLVDEVDRCAKSAGSEGDPIRLAFRRATTFRRGKKLLISSPTILDDSRIDAEYQLGTQEELHVPCPHCGEFQRLVWGSKLGVRLDYGLKWDVDASGKALPETAHYVCQVNACVIEERDKAGMIARYRWVAQAPENGPRRRSFWKNALSSNLVSWVKLVAEWDEIQGKVGELQQFINTVLAELWDPLAGKAVRLDNILDRRGDGYPEHALHFDADSQSWRGVISNQIAYITAAVDTQDDRLERAVWGWGEKDEAWLLEWDLIPGDPATREPWDALDAMLDRKYTTEAGAVLSPRCTFIDSGGHHSKEVYSFTRARMAKKVFAIKGASPRGAPLLSKPSRNNATRAILYMVGSFSGKETLVNRLARIQQPGPGYIHLPAWLDTEQAAQFTRLRLVTPVNKGGRKWKKPKPEWEETGAVEQSILYVYALAGLQSIGAVALKNIGATAKRLTAEALARAESAKDEPAPPTEGEPPADALPTDPPPPPPTPPRRGGGWMGGIRRPRW